MSSYEGFDVRDHREFRRILGTGTSLQRLATGYQFLEGPVWSNEDGGFLIFSDIPADTMFRWSETGVSVFRRPSHQSNGNTRDLEGRLITCEHGSRTVTRTDQGGNIETIAAEFGGKRLNSPNDAVVKSDGSIWFTDPPYGINPEMEQEQPACYVFRLDPLTGELFPVASDFHRPNGLCFSPDEQRLYIADSGTPRHIRVFQVQDGVKLVGGQVFCTIDHGVPDGIRCDAEGRLYSTAADGVQIFTPDGTLIGKILVPEVTANCCFGGADNQTLFLTATSSLYAIRLEVGGASRP